MSSNRLNLLIDTADKMMKEIMIKHAKSCGATEDWLDGLKDLNGITTYLVISILYGEPNIPAWKNVPKSF